MKMKFSINYRVSTIEFAGPVKGLNLTRIL